MVRDVPIVAGVAQLVEHHLAKVAVESSNLFARSIFRIKQGQRYSFSRVSKPLYVQSVSHKRHSKTPMSRG